MPPSSITLAVEYWQKQNVGLRPPAQVADSLEQFLLLFVNDPESVYVFPPGKTDAEANDSQSLNWWRTVRGWLPF